MPKTTTKIAPKINNWWASIVEWHSCMSIPGTTICMRMAWKSLTHWPMICSYDTTKNTPIDRKCCKHPRRRRPMISSIVPWSTYWHRMKSSNRAPFRPIAGLPRDCDPVLVDAWAQRVVHVHVRASCLAPCASISGNRPVTKERTKCTIRSWIEHRRCQLWAYRSRIDVRLQWFSRNTRIENVFAHIIEFMFEQFILYVLAFRSAERSAIMEFSLQQSSLAAQQFQRFSHRHTTGETVRIHHHVRCDAEVIEWQILLINDETGDTFLSVTRTEFVTDFRTTCLTQQDFDEEIFFGIGGHHHFFDVAGLGAFVGDWNLQNKIEKWVFGSSINRDCEYNLHCCTSQRMVPFPSAPPDWYSPPTAFPY